MPFYHRKVVEYMAIRKGIYKTKNGAQKTRYRFTCRYVDHNGERKQYTSRWYDTQRQATLSESDFKLSQKTPSVTVTFYDVALEWIEYTRPNNKKKTSDDKLRIVEKNCKPLLNMPIGSITSKRLKDIFHSKDMKELSTSRKNVIHGYVKSIFKYAVVFYGLPNNPMDQVMRFRKTEHERMKEMNVYTYQQFNKLYDCFIKDGNEEIADFMFILFWTGLRERELLSVTFNDFNGKSLKIWHQYIKGEWTSLKTKESKRSISLDKRCISVVKKQMNKYSTCPNFSREWFVFGGYRPLADRTIQRKHRETIQKHNLPPTRIHDMRHSHVSMLIDQGVNIYKISKRLGHSSIRITLDRYGHLLDRDEEEILSAIDNIIGNDI